MSDAETGTYYIMCRMYDPETGRFLQEDTYRGDIKDPLSLNLYTYCHNEPLMYSDPTGHFWKELWGGVKKVASYISDNASELCGGIKETASDLWNATKNTVSSIGSSIKSDLSTFTSRAASIVESADDKISQARQVVSKAMSNLQSVISKKVSDMASIIKNKSISIGNTAMQCAKNLEAHPVDTLLATTGVVFGVLGFVGSGILEVGSFGSLTLPMVATAAFSANSVISSTVDLIDIASGNYKKEGSFNPIKSVSEAAFGTIGEGADIALNKVAGKNTDLKDIGRNIGGCGFELADLYLGAKGVSKGFKTIADFSYGFKKITTIGDKIVPEFFVAENRISKAEKIGAAIDITNTGANWAKKMADKYNEIVSNYNKK